MPILKCIKNGPIWKDGSIPPHSAHYNENKYYIDTNIYCIKLNTIYRYCSYNKVAKYLFVLDFFIFILVALYCSVHMRHPFVFLSWLRNSSLPNKKESSQRPVGKRVILAPGRKRSHLSVRLEKGSSRRPVRKGHISASRWKGVPLIEVFSTAKVYFSDELYIALNKNNYYIFQPGAEMTPFPTEPWDDSFSFGSDVTSIVYVCCNSYVFIFVNNELLTRYQN